MIEFTSTSNVAVARQAMLCPAFEAAFRYLVEADTDGAALCAMTASPVLDHRPAMACVGEVPCSTVQQTGHEAFDRRAAIATRLGEVHLGGGP